MTAPAISISRNFDGPLQKLPNSEHQLLVSQEYGDATGFWHAQEDVDPNSFEIAIARALSGLGAISWLSDAGPQDEDVQLTGETQLSEKLKNLWHQRHPLYLHTSIEPERIVKLFGSDGLNWPLQGQLALVSSDDLKQLDRAMVTDLLMEPQSRKFPALWTAGVNALMLPGVDGACAGFYAKTAETVGLFCERLENTLNDMSVPYTSES